MTTFCTDCNHHHLAIDAPAVNRFDPEKTTFKAIDGTQFQERHDALQHNCTIRTNLRTQ